MATSHQLTLNISGDLSPVFSQLPERGFLIEAPIGISVRNFVCRQLGLDNRYLEDRIQTIFLDQKPVDDFDTAVIREDSTLALSAAMPGLAGATLRKGGRFATLRNQISCDLADESFSGQSTNVTVKFFNIVAKEQGPTYLKNGIRINGSNLKWFIDKYLDRLLADIQTVYLDEREIDSETLANIEWGAEVYLQVL